MKIAILSLPAEGPTNTMLPLGMELKSIGHEVHVIGLVDLKKYVQTSGLHFVPIAQTRYPSGSIDRFLVRLALCNGVKAIVLTVKMINWWVDAMLKFAPDVLKDNQYDLIIANQTCADAQTISQVTNIPFVTVCSAAILNQELSVPPAFTLWQPSDKLLFKIRNYFAYAFQNLLTLPLAWTIKKHRLKYGLKFYRSINDAFSPILQISQFPKSFEFPRNKLPSFFHFLGPFHSTINRENVDFDWEWLTKKSSPIIYASLGSLQTNQRGIYEIICQTFMNTELRLILSLGGQCPSTFPSLPVSQNIKIYRKVPQLELLPHVELFISHGGTNSAMESFLSATPMLCIPLTNDHFGCAARLRTCGAGEYLLPSKLSSSRLSSLVQEMLINTKYKLNAQKMKQEIKNSGGVMKAIELIESITRKN